MSNTLNSKLDEILIRLMGGNQQYKHSIEVQEARRRLITLFLREFYNIGLEVIGGDRDYEKYGQCPSGCGMQYGCSCDSAEFRIKHEQRERLSKITGIEGSKEQ